MKFILILSLILVLSPKDVSGQVKVIVPSQTGGAGNCYVDAVTPRMTGYMGAQTPVYDPLTQSDLSALRDDAVRKACVATFYSVDETNDLLDKHDKAYQEKLDDVKRDYVDKISSLSPEVLAAIKEEVKQQLIAELVPQIREEVKKQIKQEESAKLNTSAPKPKPKTEGAASKSNSKPDAPQN